MELAVKRVARLKQVGARGVERVVNVRAVEKSVVELQGEGRKVRVRFVLLEERLVGWLSGRRGGRVSYLCWACAMGVERRREARRVLFRVCRRWCIVME